MIEKIYQLFPFLCREKKNKAILWIKKKENKKRIIEEFAGDSVCLPSNNAPVSVFMAGSPGAGKTETAKSFLEILDGNAVHIDADEIKKKIPGYNGKNSQIFQPASAIGVEKIYDFVLKKKKNVIVDATFCDLKKAQKNIERSLKKKRIVVIVYVFQDKNIAWYFTKEREKDEGRYVPRKIFLYAYENAGKNVLEMKKLFLDKVSVFLVKKDFQENLSDFRINIGEKELEKYVKNIYNE